MATLTITKIGNSEGVILPKEILAKLRVSKDDKIHITETPEGLLITPYDSSIKEQLEIGREFMKEYRDTFKVLAE